MIDLLLVALFQVAAGAPETPATAPDPQIQQQQAPTTEGAQTPDPAAAQDRGVRCRRVVTTGTRIGRRVCTTAEQRRNHDIKVEHDINQIMRQNESDGLGSNPTGQGPGR